MEIRANLVKKSVERIREEKIERHIKKMIALLVERYDTDCRIFGDGYGRSGFAMKPFIQRLRHLGWKSFVMNETITPGIRRGDGFIAVSGSGTTEQVIASTKLAIEGGATVIVVTSKKESILARMADIVIDLPGRKGIPDTGDYLERTMKSEYLMDKEPLGTTFERNAGIFFDSVIGELIELTKTTEDEMQERHASTKTRANKT